MKGFSQQKLLRAAAAVLCGVVTGSIHAEEKPACHVWPDVVRLHDALPHVAALIASRQPVMVVAIGSSSTKGFGVPSDQNYPSRFQVEFSEAFPGTAITMINSGFGGDEMPKMRDRFATDVMPYKPDLVLLQYGVNAAFKNLPLDGMEESVRHAIRDIKATGADVILVDLQYVPKVTANPENVATVEGMMEKIAATEKVGLFHRYDLTQHWVEADHVNVDAWTIGDGLHMNAWGYRCMAQNLRAAVVEAIRPTTQIVKLNTPPPFLGVY